MIPKSAGRTPIACINCAKTKTKCDKKFPCTRCATRNLECTVRPTRRAIRNKVQSTGGGGAAAGEERMAENKSPVISNQITSEPAFDGDKTSTSSSNQSRTEKSPPKSQPSVAGEALNSTQPSDQIFQQHPSQPLSMQQPWPNGDSAAQSPSQTPPDMVGDAELPTPMSNSGQHLLFNGYDVLTTESMGSEPVSASTASLEFDIESSHTSQMLSEYEHMHNSSMLLDTVTAEPFTINDAAMVSGLDTVPFFVSHFEPGPTMLHTPISNGGFEGAWQEDFPHQHSGGLNKSPSWEAHSPSPGADTEEMIVAQDSWSAYRCTPAIPSSACPKTARLNLEKLEETLKDHGTWNDRDSRWDEVDHTLNGHLNVVSLQEMPRDKLLAITQTFLHKALEIHSEDHRLPGDSDICIQSSNFVILPPARVLEHFLRCFSNSFERFYPLSSRGIIDPNELMTQGKDKASSLLLLLMIGQGAMISTSIDGRWLTGGLTEACRISLFNLIEKNIMMSGDPTVLQSALLFTAQAGWSGDKWQMDIAMGQRGMYFAMLRHSGYLEMPSTQAKTLSQQPDVNNLWQEWVRLEGRSRLMYSWATVDQELSLFNDTPPLFSVTEFNAPMPDTQTLWQAKSAKQWSNIFERVHEFSDGYSSLGSGVRPLSLRELFRRFVNDSVVCQNIQLTPLHLRLLLHPLHSLVCQFRQLQNCLPDSNLNGSSNLAATSTPIKLKEVQSMLQRWYDLAVRYLKCNPFCPLMQASLVVFHLISLNVVTDFLKIERFARRDGIDGSFQSRIVMHKQCLGHVEEAMFHSGQVIRLIRSMPSNIRPPWWAAAMYRAALVFWCDSIIQDKKTSNGQSFATSESGFPVDDLLPEHPLVIQYLTKRRGIPTLTRRDGSHMPIDKPCTVLFHCVDVISEGVSTRFSDGICNKLLKLAKTEAQVSN